MAEFDNRPFQEDLSPIRQETIGLQARWLLGKKAHDPHNPLTPIDSTALATIEPRNFSALDHASLVERFSPDSSGDHEERKTTWFQAFSDTFKSNERFFIKTQSGKEWMRFYQKMGIEPTLTGARTFYSRYLMDVNIELFVKDVLAAHMNVQGVIDVQALDQHRRAILLLSSAFGEVSSLAIEQAIAAEANISDESRRMAFLREVNAVNEVTHSERVNTLTNQERDLLRFVETRGQEREFESLKRGSHLFLVEDLPPISEEKKILFSQRRSPTLQENPRAILDPMREVTMYFEREGEEYMQEIRALEGQITESVEPSIKAIICIPVAGHQEDRNIYDTLANYLNQTAAHSDFEILLFVNSPDRDQEGKPLSAEHTMREISRFRADNPTFPVRVVTKVFPSAEAGIGRARKYLNDIALYRYYKGANRNEDIILISNDADLKGVAPTYIANFIRQFQDDPTVDGMLGMLDWDPEAYVSNPLLHIGTRLFQYLNTIGMHKSGSIVSSGANSAFRGSIYSAIGGYVTQLTQGEDVAIGQAIIEARQTRQSMSYAGSRSRLYTSARRALTSVKEGLPPVSQWDKGFSAFDDEVRKMSSEFQDGVDYGDPERILQLKGGLERIINSTLDVYEQGERLGKGSNYYRMALRYLGISYKVTDGNIEITNIDSLLRNLKHYQEIGVLLKSIKSGKSTREMGIELKRLSDAYYFESQQKRTPPEGFTYFRQRKLELNPAPSETLINNPIVKLESSSEVRGYLAKQDPQYLSNLEALDSQITEPMQPNTRIIVCMPLAGLQEANSVYGTLKLLSEQNIESDQFEVLLFVNIPEHSENRNGLTGTLTAIDKLKTDFPDLPIRVVKAVVPNQQVRISNLRKIASDLALVRADKINLDQDIILVSADADQQGLHTAFLQTYLEYFDTHKDKEAAVGNLLFDPQAFVRFPALHVQTELVTRLDRQGFINGNVTLYGNNSAMKSSIYAGIGGYPSSLRTGEQEWTGNTINQLRKGKHTLGYAGDDAMIVTSMRRIVLTHLLGESEQVAFGNLEAEESMRSIQMESFPLFDFDQSVKLSEIIREIEEVINFIITAYESGDKLGKDAWFYRSNLSAMGIEYEVIGDAQDEESHIRVTNITDFIDRQILIRKAIESESNMAIVYSKLPDAE